MKIDSVLITGTTSGLGRALLELYVARGVNVISVNRRRVPELESRFPSVRFECIDVRAAEQVDGLVRALAEAAELPDVFFFNAGVNRVDNDESFELAAYHAIIDTNLFGVLNFVAPLTRLPVSQCPRRLVAVSSMASYVGNPYALGYYTSKKALTACFDVWSSMYLGTELVFQQVMLGPVRTAIYTMAEQFPAWMVRVKDLFSASPDAAARALSRFALTHRRRLFYPWQVIPLYLGMWLCRAIIPGFFRGRTTLRGNARRAVGRPESDG